MRLPITKEIIKFLFRRSGSEMIVVFGENRILAGEMIFAVLKGDFPVSKRWPLFSLTKKIFIVEYDKKLSGAIRPKIVVLAGIQEANKEENKEAAKLLEGLGVDDFVVLDANDELAILLLGRTRAKILKFSFDDNSDIKISNIEEKGIRIAFKFERGDNFIPVLLEKKDDGDSGGDIQAAALAVLIGSIYNINLLRAAEKLN